MKGVIYLEKSSLDYYAEGMQAIPKLAFPADVIRDIEVIDVVKLDQAVKAFITTNKLLPASLTIVLANTIVFTKDILKPPVAKPADKTAPKLSPEEQAKKVEEDEKNSVAAQTERFLETVPFSEVSSVSLPIQNGVKVIAGNKELYTYIKRAFEKYGFSVDAVTSLWVFGAAGSPVDQTIARRLLAKIDLARQHNMLAVKPPAAAKQTSFVKQTDQKESKTKLYVMLGVFGLLVIILIVMAYKTFTTPVRREKAPNVTPTLAPALSITPALDAPVGSESAELDLSNVSVQIVASTAVSSQSARLEEALEDAGIETITTKRGTSTSARTILSVAPSFPKAQRAAIQEVVSDLFPGSSILEAEDLPADVVITIGTSR